MIKLNVIFQLITNDLIPSYHNEYMADMLLQLDISKSALHIAVIFSDSPYEVNVAER